MKPNRIDSRPPFPPADTAAGILRHLRPALFYIFIIALMAVSYSPVRLKAHPGLIRSLAGTLDKAYIIPASELAPLKPLLPPSGRICFLTDHPFGEVLTEEKFFYDAQNFLCPLVLVPEAREPLAVITCSTSEIAEQRLRQSGYAWVRRTEPGRGLAGRIP